MNYEALGRQIRKHRRDRGMTQDALAKKAGISASFLGHIERGSRKASLETLVAIANILRTGTDTLLSESLEQSMDITHFEETLGPGRKKIMAEMMRILDENRGMWDK